MLGHVLALTGPRNVAFQIMPLETLGCMRALEGPCSWLSCPMGGGSATPKGRRTAG